MDAPAFNIGSLITGVSDIMVGYNNKSGDFTYGISGNISFLKNEVRSRTMTIHLLFQALD